MANNVNDRCCCLHIKAGMGVIIFLHFLYISFGFAGGVDILVKEKDDDDIPDELERPAAYLTIFIMSVWLLTLILLIVALFKDRAALMIPHLVVTIMWVVMNIAAIGVLVYEHRKNWRIEAGAIIFAVAIFLYFLITEWRCYKYIRSKQDNLLQSFTLTSVSNSCPREFQSEGVISSAPQVRFNVM